MNPCDVGGESARLSALHSYDVLDTPQEESFDRITRLAQTVLQVPVALVSLVDSDRQWFKSRQGLDVAETPRNISFCAHAILRDEALVVPDATLDPRFADNPFVTGDFGLRFYVGVPLRNRDGFKLGTLCCIDRKPRDLSPDQIAILEDLARLVVDELELRLLATTDSLTGAMGRRAFLEALARDFSRARRHGRPLSFVMLDADHFKAVNDVHGHAVGDRVLQSMVAVCAGELRKSDYIGRLGGEEFGIVLCEGGADAAATVASRLWKAVAESAVETAKGPLRITASLGIAVLDADVSDPKDLISRADAALYRAKAEGRDRCVLYDAGLAPERMRVA